MKFKRISDRLWRSVAAGAELRLIPLNGVVVALRRNGAGRFLADLSEQLGRRGSSRTVPEAFDYDDAGGNVRLIENQNRRLHQHAILFCSFDLFPEHWKVFNSSAFSTRARPNRSAAAGLSRAIYETISWRSRAAWDVNRSWNSPIDGSVPLSRQPYTCAPSEQNECLPRSQQASPKSVRRSVLRPISQSVDRSLGVLPASASATPR